MLILSDDFAGLDLIGHADYCDGLVEMIQSVASQGSFTIGIYGPWGSGKTSMLRQIQKTLIYGRQENTKHLDQKQPVHTVWFNPWQFVSEEHLIIPFFHTLIASLDKAIKEQKPGQYVEKLSDFLKKIVHIPLALTYGTEAEIKFPLLKAKFTGSKIFDYQEKKEDTINRKRIQKSQTPLQLALQKYESTYYNLLQILKEAGADLDVKIVVFIDDLDRCLPDKSVQLLEGLKVLLDLKNFVFVIGVAHEVIEHSIRVRYRELYSKNGEHENVIFFQEQYLDKIVQFPFSLPAADTESLKRNILYKELEKLEGAAPYVDMVHEALGNNPRTIKRFINTISFYLHLAKIKSEKGGDFRPDLLIKISLISYLFPTLYRQLEKYPSHLVKMEGIVREAEKEREQQEETPGEDFAVQKRQFKMTGLPIIDQWLEDDKISRLLPILKIRPGNQDNKDFDSPANVNKYVRLLATSIQSENSPIANNSITINKVIRAQMGDRMIEIPAGTFIMGDEDEGIVSVNLKSFKMDKYPVTQALYQQVMNKNPSYFKGDDRPVENVSWFDAVKFCNILSKLNGLQEAYRKGSNNEIERNYTANGYRLPTEAEWEYACRAGANDFQYVDIENNSWNGKNSENQTHGVGQKEANNFNLYDMLGNVWEWCNDWYGDYNKMPVTNPSGPASGYGRVCRGGCWYQFGNYLLPSKRGNMQPDKKYPSLGFRLSLPSGQ